MTIRIIPGPEPIRGDAQPFGARDQAQLRAAAHRARRVLPGVVGELASRELTAYADFGYRFAADTLIPRLAAEILAAEAADAGQRRARPRRYAVPLVPVDGPAHREASPTMQHRTPSEGIRSARS